MSLRRSPFVCALLAAALAFAWQFLTVRYNYHGNWTALFCTGETTAVPRTLEKENLYRFSGSTGYDGQYYHFIAHDPFLRKGYARFLDAPWLRYRRILAPGLAYLLAGGRDESVDAALFVVLLASIFLGAYWLARYALLSGRSAVWGLSFLLLPAVLISIDRLAVDLALAALTAGFVLYTREGPPWKLFVILLLAPLARETGVFLAGGCVLFHLWRRNWFRSVLFSATVLPTLAWYLFVQIHTASLPGGVDFAQVRSPYPGEALLNRLTHPIAYPLPPIISGAANALDYLGLAGAILALVLGVRVAFRKTAGAVEVAGLLFVVAALFLGASIGWHEPYGYPRTLSPLLMFLALRSMTGASLWWTLPLGLVLPRVLLQLGPQVLGVLRGIL